MSETTAAHEPEMAELSPKEKAPHKLSFRFDAITISVLLVVIASAFIIWDFRDVIWVNQREKTARSYIQPGKRLTQVERELNAAGFQTLYTDSAQPLLQVSLIDHKPMLLKSANNTLSRFTTSLYAIPQNTLFIEGDSRGLIPPNPKVTVLDFGPLELL